MSEDLLLRHDQARDYLMVQNVEHPAAQRHSDDSPHQCACKAFLSNHRIVSSTSSSHRDWAACFVCTTYSANNKDIAVWVVEADGNYGSCDLALRTSELPRWTGSIHSFATEKYQ